MNVDYEIETAMSYIEKNKYSKAGDKFVKCFEYVKHTFGQESIQFEGFLLDCYYLFMKYINKCLDFNNVKKSKKVFQILNFLLVNYAQGKYQDLYLSCFQFNATRYDGVSIEDINEIKNIIYNFNYEGPLKESILFNEFNIYFVNKDYNKAVLICLEIVSACQINLQLEKKPVFEKFMSIDDFKNLNIENLIQGYYYMGLCHYLQKIYHDSIKAFNNAKELQVKFNVDVNTRAPLKPLFKQMTFMINQIGMVIPIHGLLKTESINNSVYDQQEHELHNIKTIGSIDYFSVPKNASKEEQNNKSNLNKSSIHNYNNQSEKILLQETKNKHTGSLHEAIKIYGGKNKKDYSINSRHSHSTHNVSHLQDMNQHNTSKKSLKDAYKRDISNNSDSTEDYMYNDDLMIFQKNHKNFKVVNSSMYDKLNKEPSSKNFKFKDKNLSMKIDKNSDYYDSRLLSKELQDNNQEFIAHLSEKQSKVDEENSTGGEEQRIKLLDKIRSKMK